MALEEVKSRYGLSTTCLGNNDEYYYNEFKKLQGTMGLVEMSSNNDGHIMRLIFENKDINKVIFCYQSENDKKATEDLCEGDKE